MTLQEYIARLKGLRATVAELRARVFTEGVDDAPVNMPTYGGDLVAIYATLTDMVKDVGGFEGEPPADAPRGLEDSEEKEDYL
jgi:hypothetical protein